MKPDFITVSFDGGNSAEFLENLAIELAGCLDFENHGALNEVERAAFRWGFRYGISHMISLLEQANRRGPNEFVAMSCIFHEAVATWDLSCKPEIAMMIPAVNPDKETP